MEGERGGGDECEKMKRGISSLWPQAIAINLIKSCGFLITYVENETITKDKMR